MTTDRRLKGLRPFAAALAAGVFTIMGAAGDGGEKAKGEAPENSGALRFVEDESSGKLQSGLIHLKGDDGVTVDLYGAVHIAEKDYYDELNDAFKEYDAVLFELVGGDGEVEEKLRQKEKDNHPIRFFQIMFKNMLALEYQIDAIDYTPDNFVHADMSSEQFSQEMADRGESLQSIIERAFKAQIEATGDDGKPSATPDLSVLAGIFTGDASADDLKLELGRTLGQMENLVGMIEGDDGSVILSGRNQVAVEKIHEMIEAGKKKLAVFYGAAHLPGIADALVEDSGFSRDGLEWLTAWDALKPDAETEEDADPETPSEKEEAPEPLRPAA